jgi:hypothetical protein
MFLLRGLRVSLALLLVGGLVGLSLLSSPRLDRKAHERQQSALIRLRRWRGWAKPFLQRILVSVTDIPLIRRTERRTASYRSHDKDHFPSTRSGEHYQALTAEFGAAYYTRIDAPVTPEQNARLERLLLETQFRPFCRTV